MVELGRYEWNNFELGEPFQYGEKLIDISMILTHPEHLEEYPSLKEIAQVFQNFSHTKLGQAANFDALSAAPEEIVTQLHRAQRFLQCFVENDRYNRIFQPDSPLPPSPEELVQMTQPQKAQTMTARFSKRPTPSLDASQFTAAAGRGYIDFLDHILEHAPHLFYEPSAEDKALLTRISTELTQPRSKTIELK